MISGNKLSVYFGRRCDNISGSLRKFCGTNEHEEIHKLRVEFKKIKALMSLVKECSDRTLIFREFETAKIVYRRAGVVRDAYISNQNQKDVASATEKINNSFLEHASEEFCSKKELHLKVITEWKESVSGKFENIGNSCALSYYHKWLARLSERFFLIETEELHECRKIIKRLMYLNVLLPPAVEQALRINVTYLDALQEEIGKWHDTLIAREHCLGSESKNTRILKKLEKEGMARLRSIKILAKNFDEKYSR